jgi:multidrug resistance efflux pump
MMMTLSTRTKNSIKPALAVVIAYGISLGVGWENPYWAGFTVAMISPTFEWIRLAQRVPVRIQIDLDKLPEEVKLRVGTTTSVLVMTGTSGSTSDKSTVMKM